MPTLRLKIALFATCLLAASCTYQEVAEEEHSPPPRQKQLETLETLAALEKQVVAVAESFPEVRAARVYIRPQASIVLLSPLGTWEIPQQAIDTINDYVMRETGQRLDQITIKITRVPDSKTEPETEEGAER